MISMAMESEFQLCVSTAVPREDVAQAPVMLMELTVIFVASVSKVPRTVTCAFVTGSLKTRLTVFPRTVLVVELEREPDVKQVRPAMVAVPLMKKVPSAFPWMSCVRLRLSVALGVLPVTGPE